MDKKQIREMALDKRRSLTSKDIEDASASVYEYVIQIDAIIKAKKVLIYSHFDNEIKTAGLTGWLLYQGKELYLPSIVEKDMYALNIRNAKLEMSKFGVAQPSTDIRQAVNPAKLDVIIVPGVAFDKDMNRLGFGFGYYDTYMEHTKRAVKIALAYDFQIVGSIPAEPHDIKMDMVVTPDGIIKKP